MLRLFEMENTKLTFTPEALNQIAIKAIVRKTGARGLRSILEQLLLDTMYDLPDLTDVEEVVINEETVKDNKKPVFVHSDKKKKKAEKAKEEDKDAVVTG